MEWNYCLLIFMISLLSQSHASTIFVERKASWTTAHSECYKQGGTLAYTNDVNTCGNISNSKIWLGVTTQIAKYGCYAIIEKPLIRDTLFKCYKFCNTTLFGFREARCSCIHTDTDIIVSAPDSACKASSEFRFLWLYNKTEEISNSNTVLNCVYVKCPDRNSLTTIGTDALFDTGNCSQQLDGFACLVHHPEYNTSVKPSLVNYVGTTIIEPLQTNSMHIQHVSTNTLIPFPETELWIKSTVPIQSSIGSSDVTVRTSFQITLASSMISSFVSSSSYYGNASKDVQHKSSTFMKSSGSVSIQAQSKNESSILPTSVTSDLLSNHARKHLASKSVITSSIVPTTKHFQMPTTVYGLFATITNTEKKNEINHMYSTITMSSNNSRSHKNSTVRTRLQSKLRSSITSLFESSSSCSGYLSTDVQHKSTVKASMFRRSSSRVSIHVHSNVGSSILPTSVKSDLFTDHASKQVPSKSVSTSAISTTIKNFLMPTTVYGSFATITNKEELSETNTMHSTTIMNSNNLESHQKSTGLIVGVSVSILAVLLIGVFGICLLRHQCPFKEKTEDYAIPSTNTKDPNYQDIDFDLKKDTHLIENDSKHPMLATKGADIQFIPTDNISNSRTNISNNAYAVVVKIPAATNTTKAEKNEDKDEHSLLSIHENDYDMLNKLRPISGNECSNLYDTSGERLDDNDPTYNTTTHMHTRDRELESDYDNM